MIEDILHITAVHHSRKKFYNGKDIRWYEFLFDDGTNITIDEFRFGRNRFLRVPETKYYEFGGSHEDAIKLFIQGGFNIVEGNEI